MKKKTLDGLLNEALRRGTSKSRPYQRPVRGSVPRIELTPLAQTKNLKGFVYLPYVAGLNVKQEAYEEIMDHLGESDLDPAMKKEYLGKVLKILKAKSGKILSAEDTDGYAGAMEMHLNTGYVFIDHDYPNMMTSFDSEDYWVSPDDEERHYEGEEEEDGWEEEEKRVFGEINFKSGISSAIDWMTDCKWEKPKNRY
jgi:hypothetical protein